MICSCFNCGATIEYASRKRAETLIAAGWTDRKGGWFCRPCSNLPPKRVRDLIDQVKEGVTLNKTFVRLETGNVETAYVLRPSNRSVGTATAEAAIASGKLRPRPDGLFSDTPQSWEGA